MLLKILFSLFLIFNIIEAKIKSIETRENSEQLFDVIKPKNSEPIATVILFAGGGGYLKMNQQKWKKKGNFLVRSRKLFMKNNLAVAVIDAPSEYRDTNGMPAKFRTTKEHLMDVEGVIKYLQKRFNKPVWVVGTSRGTISATYLAINSKNINGLILSASISEANKRGDLLPLYELDLEKISIPTLLVHHKNDNCYVSKVNGAQKIFDKLTTYKKEIKIFEGGLEKSDPCKGKSHHGFYKIEEDVVSYISDFIKKNSK